MRNVNEFYFKDIDKSNLPTTIEFEEGRLLVNDYLSGYGSGKKTVIDGRFETTNGHIIPLEKVDILTFRNKVEKSLNIKSNRKEYISTTNNKQFDLESALSAKFLRILNEEEKNDIMDFINQVNSRVKEEMIKKEAEDLLAKLGPEQLEELKKLLKDH